MLQSLRHPVSLTAGANTISNAIRLGVSLFSIPIVLKGYGQEALGVWFFATSLIMLTGFAQAGLAGAAITSIGRDHDKTNRSRIQPVLWAGFTLAALYSACFLVVSVILVSTIEWVPFVGARSVSEKSIKCLLASTSLAIAIGFFFSSAKAALVGSMRGYAFYATEAVARIVGLLVFLVCMWANQSLSVLFLALFVTPELIAIVIVFGVLIVRGEFRSLS